MNNILLHYWLKRCKKRAYALECLFYPIPQEKMCVLFPQQRAELCRSNLHKNCVLFLESTALFCLSQFKLRDFDRSSYLLLYMFWYLWSLVLLYCVCGFAVVFCLTIYADWFSFERHSLIPWGQEQNELGHIQYSSP